MTHKKGLANKMIRIVIIGVLVIALAGGSWQAFDWLRAPNPDSILGAVKEQASRRVSVGVEVGAVATSAPVPSLSVGAVPFAQVPLVPRYYYTVNVVEVDQGDVDNIPFMKQFLDFNAGESWDQVFFDDISGMWIVEICATNVRHNQEHSNNGGLVGMTISEVAFNLNRDVDKAHIRSAMMRQYYFEGIDGNRQDFDGGEARDGEPTQIMDEANIGC